MEYYSAIKIHEILVHVTIWGQLKNSMLSVIKQSHIGHILYNPNYTKCPIDKSLETRRKLVVARD